MSNKPKVQTRVLTEPAVTTEVSEHFTTGNWSGYSLHQCKYCDFTTFELRDMQIHSQIHDAVHKRTVKGTAQPTEGATNGENDSHED